MIEAVNLSKRYADGTLALDALNLRVEPGEIYCLLGTEDAGKTTAINLLLGFLSPTAGHALIDGVDVADEPLRARERSAYLAATTSFYRRLTVLQNLEFFARLATPHRPSRHDLEMTLREVGLPETDFDRPVGALGPGGVRKLGVAAALMKRAPALLFDEPLAGLDPRAAADVVALLEELRGQGKALLITMQELFWASQLADRVGILEEGRQVLTRTREQLRFENLEQLYLDYMQGRLRVSAAPRR